MGINELKRLPMSELNAYLAAAEKMCLDNKTLIEAGLSVDNANIDSLDVAMYQRFAAITSRLKRIISEKLLNDVELD